MRLVYTEGARIGEEVKIGDPVSLRSGEKGRVESIMKPHSPTSTGRVFIDFGKFCTGYFPSVVGAMWIEREDHGEGV